MLQSAFDTIIIGGGPAGSTAGAFLARSGQRVLIVEKEVFPRFHIGESLLPFGNDVLQASGVWPKVAAAGFQSKLGAEFGMSNGARAHRFWFARGLVPGYGQTFQVERAQFDQVLLNHAGACGCELRQPCAVQSVARAGDEWRVTLTAGEARSRWLLDASGRDTFLARALQLPREPFNVPKRVAVYAHFTGVYRNDGDAGGHIVIIRLADGWFWLIPLAHGKTSVGMVRVLEDLKQFGGTSAEWFAHTVTASSELTRRMANAQRIGEFYTTSDYSYRYGALATDRALLVGDAGGFIDPIFSSGVYIATASAQLAAQAILAAGPRGLSARAQRRYGRAVHRMMDVFLKMILMFYDQSTFEVFMHPRSRFGLVEAVNSILAGNARHSFAIAWRLRLFRLICAVHRRVPLVPRLNFSERVASVPEAAPHA